VRRQKAGSGGVGTGRRLRALATEKIPGEGAARKKVGSYQPGAGEALLLRQAKVSEGARRHITKK